MTIRARPKSALYPNVLLYLKRDHPDAVAEFRFHPVRRWRSDFAIPSKNLLIEIDGGAWSGGRHTQGAGFIADQKKTNAAAVLGYHVLRFIPKDVKTGLIFLTINEFMKGKL